MNKYKNMVSKIETLHRKINSLRPLKNEEVFQLRDYFKVGLTYSSNALEGNSLTETETKVVLEDGVTIGGKPVKDHLEVLGHSEAYDYLYKILDNKEIKEEYILELHRLFYHRINEEKAGKYRTVKVFVSGSETRFPSPENIKDLMERFMEEMPKIRANNHPVHSAALLHKELVSIHPFIDGNGRVSRLIMNLCFLQDGFPIVSIPPIVRADYLDSLRASDQGDNEPFLNFISQMVYDSQKDYLRLLE